MSVDKKFEDYTDVMPSKNVKHVIDESGKGWFCYCGNEGEKVQERTACCFPEGASDFERVG
jgi:hypothetical protein